MDSTKQEEEAEKNIRNSAEYRFDVINNRRNEFYKEFLLENSLSGEYIERKENN